MKTKYRCIAAAVLCGIAVLSLAYGNADKNNPQSVYYQYGEIEKEYGVNKASASDETAVEAKDFTIQKSELDALTKENILAGHDEKEAYSMALDQLTAKYTVYNYAVGQGYQVTDKYIDNLIAVQKSDMAKASNSGDFKAFLSGAGMTEDEYWESQRETMRTYETIANFKNAFYENERSKLAAANGAYSKAADVVIEGKYNDFVAQLIESENVTVS